MIQRFCRARVIATYKNFSCRPRQHEQGRKKELGPLGTYFDTNTRMACPIERWSFSETFPIRNTIQNQTPLIGSRRGIFKKVIQYNLFFVDNEVTLKEIEAHIVEFKTFALVQSPVEVD